MRRVRAWTLAPLLAGLPLACGNGGRVDRTGTEMETTASTDEEVRSSMRLTSEAFEDGGTIPRRHTCDGEDLSPALEWEDAPEGTASFALVVHDPDAPRGDWVHWVIYDIPGHFTSLPEDVGSAKRLDHLGEAGQGENDFGRIGWGGPCPPPGKPHRYVFTLRALESRVELDPGAPREEVERATGGHVLATARLTGLYGR